MIIGEFNASNFDNYEEDSYDYLFKRKSKAERQEKRLTRKENKQLKKVGAIPGKRKHPLLGNFGMFDKKKRKAAMAASDTIKVGVQSADMNVDTPPPLTSDPESTPTPVLPPAKPVVLNTAPASIPATPVLTKTASSDNAEIKLPSTAINAIVASDSEKVNSGTTEKVNAPGSDVTPSKEAVKGDQKKGNIKEAGFSSILGFAFLGVTIIIVGFALFKADQKSRQELNSLKATV